MRKELLPIDEDQAMSSCGRTQLNRPHNTTAPIPCQVLQTVVLAQLITPYPGAPI